MEIISEVFTSLIQFCKDVSFCQAFLWERYSDSGLQRAVCGGMGDMVNSSQGNICVFPSVHHSFGKNNILQTGSIRASILQELYSPRKNHPFAEGSCHHF